MSAILAKAMNSTMGTSDFKAFDTLIMKDKSIAYSETVLCSPPIEQNIRLDYSQQGAIADVEKEIISLRMRATGSFGIKETTTVQDSSKVSNVAVTGGIRVYRNGKVFSGTSHSSLTGNVTDETTSEALLTNIPCLPGDIISIRQYCIGNGYSNGYTYTGYSILRELKILGTVSESAFDIVLN